MTAVSPNRRFSAGIWMFGQFVDRFATDGYGPEVPMPDAIRLAASVGGDPISRPELPLLGAGRLHFVGAVSAGCYGAPGTSDHAGHIHEGVQQGVVHQSGPQGASKGY